MKKTDNKEMLNAIREQASAEYQEKVPMVADTIQPRTVLTKLEEYPTIKNEFIQTLINKVVKTDFFSRVYSNPLKELKKGTLPYGATIEELFVLAAEAKGFFDDAQNYGGGGNSDGFDKPNRVNRLNMLDSANELMGTKKADIKKLYISLNFAHVFKTSISDSQLAHAFTSQNGLSELVNQITSSLVNGVEQREYKDMIGLIKSVCAQKQPKTNGTGLITTLDTSGKTDDIPLPIGFTKDSFSGGKDAYMKTHDGVLQVMYKHNIGEGTQGKQLSKAIRSLSARMKFVNTKYNMAGVPTFCNPEDLVLLTTPEIVADMDVEVLASAFNVSSADIKTRIIIVDELPTRWARGHKAQDNTEAGVGYYYKATNDSNQSGASVNTLEGDCVGILMDKNFIQAIDTVNEARQFENGRALMTNLFLHRQGMLANCYFANCVALFTNTGYGKVSPLNPQS